MALALEDPRVLEELRCRGFAALSLSSEQAAALEAAQAACAHFFSSAEPGTKQRCMHRGPPRSAELPALPLHGLGYVSTPEYGGREQFHAIRGAVELCAWPDEEFREAFEQGTHVLQRVCLDLLERVDPAAVAEWREQVCDRGDPSVCDAFLYPAGNASSAATGMAMGRHFDPGWFTIKRGSRDGGLQVWDRSCEAWVDVEGASFYTGSKGSTEPESALVVFAGERLATWTEGVIPAVPHRVRACAADRLSFIFELRDHVC